MQSGSYQRKSGATDPRWMKGSSVRWYRSAHIRAFALDDPALKPLWGRVGKRVVVGRREVIRDPRSHHPIVRFKTPKQLSLAKLACRTRKSRLGIRRSSSDAKARRHEGAKAPIPDAAPVRQGGWGGAVGPRAPGTEPRGKNHMAPRPALVTSRLRVRKKQGHDQRDADRAWTGWPGRAYQR